MFQFLKINPDHLVGMLLSGLGTEWDRQNCTLMKQFGSLSAVWDDCSLTGD